jgi:hypothetical protein
MVRRRRLSLVGHGDEIIPEMGFRFGRNPAARNFGATMRRIFFNGIAQLLRILAVSGQNNRRLSLISGIGYPEVVESIQVAEIGIIAG